MTDSEILHKLLYLALIDIREYGRSTNHKGIHNLANLFHNVVLQLQKASDGEVTYEEVLQSLKSKADEIGCSDWLESYILQLKSNSEFSKPN